MENVKDANDGVLFCHDCKKGIEVKNEELQNGTVLVFDDNGEKINIVKCNDCYDKNPTLNNFRKCEVYSRVVGYIRPVAQWNEGKQEEYKDRKMYKINDGCC